MAKSKQAATAAVRIDALLYCCCVSVIDGDGSVCCTVTEFREYEPHDAIEKARAAGWQFRGRSARCPVCTAAGRPFGTVS